MDVCVCVCVCQLRETGTSQGHTSHRWERWKKTEWMQHTQIANEGPCIVFLTFVVPLVVFLRGLGVLNDNEKQHEQEDTKNNWRANERASLSVPFGRDLTFGVFVGMLAACLGLRCVPRSKTMNERGRSKQTVNKR